MINAPSHKRTSCATRPAKTRSPAVSTASRSMRHEDTPQIVDVWSAACRVSGIVAVDLCSYPTGLDHQCFQARLHCQPAQVIQCLPRTNRWGELAAQICFSFREFVPALKSVTKIYCGHNSLSVIENTAPPTASQRLLNPTISP